MCSVEPVLGFCFLFWASVAAQHDVPVVEDHIPLAHCLEKAHSKLLRTQWFIVTCGYKLMNP